jgi:hypothetical protein
VDPFHFTGQDLAFPGEPQPVELMHVRDHVFQKAGRKKQKGERCQQCGKAFSNILHHGYPPSLNLGGSGWNPHVYQGLKQAWQTRLMELLGDSGLPHDLEHVLVEGQICFPDRRTDRDQDNFKFLLSKAMGDALEVGGWLERDSWDHYEFGGLSKTYAAGEAWTRLVVFPTARMVDSTLYPTQAGDADH